VDAAAWLEQLDAELGASALEEALVPLAYVAGRAVDLDEEELRAARRRALLVLAAGGDPRRPLAANDRAVLALAADLDRPERRVQLAEGLAGLRHEADLLPRVGAALDRLLDDSELGWRSFASALLADELSDSDD
jgi:hypothetical protein